MVLKTKKLLKKVLKFVKQLASAIVWASGASTRSDLVQKNLAATTLACNTIAVYSKQ